MPVVGRVVVGFAAGSLENVVEKLAIEKRCDQWVVCFECVGVLRKDLPVSSAEPVDVALRPDCGSIDLVDLHEKAEDGVGIAAAGFGGGENPTVFDVLLARHLSLFPWIGAMV